MSNETDLDWLARNVHEWPAGEHQPWCYVYMTYGGVMKAAGNFLDAVANPAMITIDQWLARRAELQNKPSWEGAPEWAELLAQDDSVEWYWYASKTAHQGMKSWWPAQGANNVQCGNGEVLGDWRDTMELRSADLSEPAVTERLTKATQTVLAAAPALMDEKFRFDRDDWFERGELPPVGCECEILGAFGHYQEWFPCKIIAEHSGSVFAANERSWMNVRKGERQFRPLRTERDVLIEIIKKTDDTDDRIADAILAAGFKRGAA